LGVHWIDLFRWLLMSEISAVIGRNVRVNQKYDIEDNSFAICTFAGGATLALDISYTVPDSYPFGRDLFLAVRGTEGCLSFSPASLGLEYVADIADNVLNKREPLIGGGDAIKALEVAEAIYRSANSGKVVELNP
jgi:UDP-N-acetylglucosamine 3-dehydrogenase